MLLGELHQVGNVKMINKAALGDHHEIKYLGSTLLESLENIHARPLVEQLKVMLLGLALLLIKL